MDSSEKPKSVMPRIIVHGGAGNITKQNLPRAAYQAYRAFLLAVLGEANELLRQPGAAAIDVATHAVSLLENNPLFNAGHGAVFTRAETHELEASVMVSKGYRKRGVGVMKVTRAKNPILLAKEMLIRGEEDDGGGAGPHCQLEGETCDRLAEEWGLDLVKPSYYWTRKRWEEHRRGMGKSYDDGTYEKHRRDADSQLVDADGKDAEQCPTDFDRSWSNDPSWDGKEYLAQGTVGTVVLDSHGTVCVATSTGGLTNKLPGRIGDTPTLGAGFWAEEWIMNERTTIERVPSQRYSSGILNLVGDCLPGLSGYISLPTSPEHNGKSIFENSIRAVAMSGTGNGDSFLRLNAVRTAAAMSRWQRNTPNAIGNAPLQDTVSAMAGPGGMLQQSAEDRWLKSGEGEGGIIGIDLKHGKGTIVADFNCGGMFRTWIDDDGMQRMAVFREEA